MADHVGLAAFPVQLPPNYTYKILHVNKNTAEIRIKEVMDGITAEKWISDYNNHTKQTFKTGKTFPVCGRVNVFKKGYRCHRNTRTSCIKHKNTNCKAWISLTVRRCGDFSRKYSRAKKPDPLLPEWPAIVEMKHEHNHPVDMETLQYRPVSPEVKMKLLELYRKGYSPTAAFNTLKLDLMTDCYDFENKVVDRHFLPDLKFCYRLFYKYKQSTQHEPDSQITLTIQSLVDSVSKYCELNGTNGGNIRFHKNGGEFCVAICTPLMSRVHANLLESGEVVLVEKVTCSDKSGMHRYMFLTKSAAGVLPLAVGLTTSQSESGLRMMFKLMQSSLPAMTAFAEKGPEVGPDVFVIDDDHQPIQRALRSVWNISDIMMSPMRVLKTMWRWLLSKSSGILDEDRRILFTLFKRAVHSATLQELQENCDFILQNATAQSHPKYLSYINGLWERRTEWALCYHPSFQKVRSITLAEGVLRVLKEKLLMNTKTLDGGELLETFMVRTEKCYEACLLDMCHMRNDVLSKRLVSQQDEQVYVQQIDNDMYSVSIDTNLSVVDTSVMLCTCLIGQKGNKLCKHQVAVIQDKAVGELIVVISQVTNLRQALYVIATAKDPPPQWLCSSFASNESEFAVNVNAIKLHDVQEESSDEYQGVVQFEEVKFEGKGTEMPYKATEVKHKLRRLCTEWEQKVDSNPLVYASAFDKFVTNYQETCTDDEQLVEALCRFGEQVPALDFSSSVKKRPAHLTFHDYSVPSTSNNTDTISHGVFLPLSTIDDLQENDRPISLNEIVAQFVLSS